MIKLLELISVARDTGVDIGKYDNHKMGTPIEYKPSTPDTDFWSAIAQCQPFVFNGPPIPDEDLPYDTPTDWALPVQGAPFPVFSIERRDGPLVTYEAHKRIINIFCIVIIELLPNQFVCIGLMENEGRLRVSTTQTLKPVINYYLNKIGKERLGSESVRISIKLGAGKAKRIHRIRQIIHVAPKTVIQNAAASFRAIDWSHRFNVRGHWRKYDGLGKDRTGEYCIDGYTWVVSHEKGPEHLPLIKKTRFVTAID